MAAKFFTGLPLDGPDPECAAGHGAEALSAAGGGTLPRPALDHSHRGPVRGQPVPVAISPRPPIERPPSRACDENPLSGLATG
jgi:hypothetical protein